MFYLVLARNRTTLVIATLLAVADIYLALDIVRHLQLNGASYEGTHLAVNASAFISLVFGVFVGASAYKKRAPWSILYTMPGGRFATELHSFLGDVTIISAFYCIVFSIFARLQFTLLGVSLSTASNGLFAIQVAWVSIIMAYSMIRCLSAILDVDGYLSASILACAWGTLALVSTLKRLGFLWKTALILNVGNPVVYVIRQTFPEDRLYASAGQLFRIIGEIAYHPATPVIFSVAAAITTFVRLNRIDRR